MTDRDALARSFGAQADAYAIGRPDYPAEAVAWLLGPATRVADVGAGTGKLTRVIADLGREVVAIEPDPLMRDRLAAELPGITALAGTGEELPLADASVDAVTFGQAWHWVDSVAGSREAARALRPDGVLALIWNVRDPAVDWVARLTEIMSPSQGELMALNDEVPHGPPFAHVAHRRWKWTRPMTRDQILRMVESRSPVITAPEAERRRILAETTELLDTEPSIADTEVIAMPYLTRAWRLTR